MTDHMLAHAYADGELDGVNALDFERRMAADAALAAEYRRIMALRGALRDKLREPMPADLRARIERATGLARPAAAPSLAPSWRALAASVALAVMVTGAGTWFALRPGPDDASFVVANHMRALMAAQPIDVSSSDRHTVKPWFNGRIAQSPRVVDLTAEGFPLVGGRVDVVGRTPVPTLVYRHRQHLISLTEMPAHALTNTTQHTADGYNLVSWTQDGVTYWAVSDVAAADLDTFARLFRAAPADR
jgi:anti-sigma factor RsiW